MTLLGIGFVISIIFGGIWLNRVGQNRETVEEHDEDGVEGEFQMARVKLDRNGEGDRKAPDLRNCSINI